MIGQRTGDERFDFDAFEVNRFAEHFESAPLQHHIVLEDIEELAMQSCRQICAVHAPRQNVKGRRILPHEVVVAPIVPNQIIRPHPGEHVGKTARRQDTLAC